MKRPSFQFYAYDWQGNSNLKRCSHEEKGIWMDVLCLMHDQEEYGVLRWSLKEIAQAVGTTVQKLKSLIAKGVMKGADEKQFCEEYTYTPRSGRKDGETVTLIARQEGAIWYSSRMVKDEHLRTVRGGDNVASKPTPNHSPKGGLGEGLDAHQSTHPSHAQASRAAPSSSSSSSSSNTTQPRARETDFQKVFDAGTEAFPNLMPKNSSAIHSWLAKGASPELDIIPTIQGFAGRSISTWTYFTAAIEQATSNRLAGLPPPVTSKSPRDSNAFIPIRRATEEEKMIGFAKIRDRLGTETMNPHDIDMLNAWEAKHGKIDWKNQTGTTQ